MGVIGLIVAGFQRGRRVFRRVCQGRHRLVLGHAVILDRAALARVGGQALENIVFRQRTGRVPVAGGEQSFRGLDHRVFIGADDRDEAAVLDNVDATLAQSVGCLVVHAFKARIIMGGAHDAGMQHARQLHVVQKAITAGNDFRQAKRSDFLADDFMGLRVFDVNIRVDIDTERLVPLDFFVSYAAIGIPRLDEPVIDFERVCVDAELFRGQCQHVPPCGCGREPYRAAGFHHRVTARCYAFIRCFAGGGAHHVDAVQRHVEFLGGDHGKCG